MHFFGPILRGQGVRIDNGWNATLYQDSIAPALHITFLEAHFQDMRPMRKKSKKRYRLASIKRKTATSKPTSTSGSGDAVSLLKVSDSANPVVTTAQLVVASSRVRDTVLRYSSPR
jgi:hypothetical protein